MGCGGVLSGVVRSSGDISGLGELVRVPGDPATALATAALCGIAVFSDGGVNPYGFDESEPSNAEIDSSSLFPDPSSPYGIIDASERSPRSLFSDSPIAFFFIGGSGVDATGLYGRNASWPVW